MEDRIRELLAGRGRFVQSGVVGESLTYHGLAYPTLDGSNAYHFLEMGHPATARRIHVPVAGGAATVLNHLGYEVLTPWREKALAAVIVYLMGTQG